MKTHATLALVALTALSMAACGGKVDVETDVSRDTVVPIDTSWPEGQLPAETDTVVMRDTVVVLRPAPGSTNGGTSGGGTGTPGTGSTPPGSNPPPGTASRNIRVSSPRPGAVIDGSRFVLAGTSRTFEASASYRLRDSGGRALTDGHFMAAGPMGEFSPFSTTVTFLQPYAGPARLEVFQFSAKDGTEIDKVVIPLTLRSGGATTGSQVRLGAYFPNSVRNPGAVDCARVFPVSRRATTPGVAAAALRALLSGPTAAEQQQGYLTSIPVGTRLNSIRIDNGVATADFNATLNTAAGSCAVTAARAQIEQTLRQFPSVRRVVLTVNGSPEGVLQP